MGSEKKKKPAVVKTRVVASTEAEPVVKKTAKSAKSSTKKQPVKSTRRFARLRRKERTPDGTTNYFVGAWRELRQVRWPDRATTWSMTFAVIMFTLFFVVLVLLLDAGNKYLFDFAIKK